MNGTGASVKDGNTGGLAQSGRCACQAVRACSGLDRSPSHLGSHGNCRHNCRHVIRPRAPRRVGFRHLRDDQGVHRSSDSENHCFYGSRGIRAVAVAPGAISTPALHVTGTLIGASGAASSITSGRAFPAVAPATNVPWQAGAPRSPTPATTPSYPNDVLGELTD